MSRRIKLFSAALLSLAAIAASVLVVWAHRRDGDAIRLLYTVSIKKRDIGDTTRNVLEALADAGIQAQGYALTGETIYREAYASDIRSYQDELATLKLLAVHDPAMPLAQELATLGNRVLDELAAVVSLYDKNGRDAALDRIRKGSGIVYLNQARGILARMDEVDGGDGNLRAISRSFSALRHLLEGAAGLFVLAIAGAVLLALDRNSGRRPD